MKSPAYTFVAGTQIAWQQHSLNHFLPSLSFPSLLWHTCPFLPLVNSPLERFRGTCRCAPTREISQGPPANDEKKAPLTIQERTQGMLPDALTFHKSQSQLALISSPFFLPPPRVRGNWFFRLVAHRQLDRVVSNFFENKFDTVDGKLIQVRFSFSSRMKMSDIVRYRLCLYKSINIHFNIYCSYTCVFE